ncbi:hypothetical protein ABIE26_003712 [Pedobacter africanus]|uniref:Uncharacterized protein n=1 Tax=Pedobacter africanus TaxID=151894 RepID=A0ACC6L0I1_9SPHI|nr:hypothetical protein [Pedobacter africanus]MDR6785014.1 hypothetical protein [Pedobacter africanus]
MKKGYMIFWGLYMLFFAVPFPMILYYNINSEFDTSTLIDRSPWLALGILAVSIVLWLILLIGYFRKWIWMVFIAKRNVEQLKAEGEPREAKILTAVKLSKPGAACDTYELGLSFKNLVGTDIVQKMGINDAKPHERRFEVGKKVNLLIDREMKRVPYFIFATSEASIKIPRLIMIFLGWLALVAAVIAYYVYAYQTESQGMGWRFMGFGHPLLICPAILLLYRFFLGFLLGKLGGATDDAALIKFKGIRTSAKLLGAGQTGTYINEQPMIRFELEYTDDQRRVYRKSLKKIVNLLDLQVTKQEYIEIFYLKENPERIAFARDLDEIS